MIYQMQGFGIDNMNMKKIKEFMQQYSALLIVLAVIAVLGYGFTITHYSVGIDNTKASFYYDEGGIIAQGRMTLTLIDKIIMPLDGTPFWSNAVGVIILYAAVVLWAFLLRRASKDTLSQPAMIAFAGIMMSYPIINETFIYNPWSFSISYLLCGLALLYTDAVAAGGSALKKPYLL